MQNNLKVGDTIQCYNTEDCIWTMNELASCGVETDFLYEKRWRNRFVVRDRKGDGRWTKRKLEKIIK